jgi:microcompartment protein CcmL/EutN
MNTPAAIAILEFDSIAVGTLAADAMVKKAPLDTFRVGTVQPGKYLILAGGAVAAVEESHREGLRIGGAGVTDHLFLPDVHPQVYAATEGVRRADDGDALGVIETSTLPANVAAADKAIKTAEIAIVEIRLGDGLGGKGVTLLTGLIHDVQAAIEAAVAVAERPGVTTQHSIIAIQHGELRERVRRSTRFFPLGASAPPPRASEENPTRR